MTPTLYMLDTNIASYALKGHPQVQRHLLNVPISQVSISAITEAELRYGVARKPQAVRLPRILGDFLLHVDVLPWDSEAAQRYGHLRAELERTGHSMGAFDTMIAAHALVTDAVLVTHDRGFRWVRTLRIEDWAKA